MRAYAREETGRIPGRSPDKRGYAADYNINKQMSPAALCIYPYSPSLSLSPAMYIRGSSAPANRSEWASCGRSRRWPIRAAESRESSAVRVGVREVRLRCASERERERGLREREIARKDNAAAIGRRRGGTPRGMRGFLDLRSRVRCEREAGVSAK